MKRYIAYFVSAIIVVAMCMTTSCSDGALCETIVEETPEDCHWQCADINFNVHRINFDIQISETRSIDDVWKEGDRVYLILKDKDGNNVQAYVEYDASVASWGQVEFYGNKSILICTEPRTVEAYYFDGEMDVTDTNVTFDAATGIYTCADGTYIYPVNGELEVNVLLTPLTGRIRFSGERGSSIAILSGVKGYTGFSRTTGLLTEALVGMDVAVDKTGCSPYIYGVFANQEFPTLIVESNGDAFKTIFEPTTSVLRIGYSGYMTIPTAESHCGWKQTEVTTGLSLDRTTLLIAEGDTALLQAFLTPAGSESDVAWTSSDTSIVKVSKNGVVTAVAVGNATITATAYDNTGVKGNCRVTVPDTNGYECVDLGLTSGTLWATMNVGAFFPADGGSYFAWGEVEEKETYSWSTYKYCNGTGDVMTKYNDVDNLTELELSDDAARYHWGGSWRMPSSAHFRELCKECTWTWTTQSGIYGYLITSKKNANAIFLPVAGNRNDSYDNFYENKGCYWSSDRSSGSSAALCLNFSSSHVYSSFYYIGRCVGHSIRPVLCRK